MNATSRRFTLRDGTWTIHQQLDTAIGPLNSLSAYRRYLASIMALRGGVEDCFQTISWPDFLKEWRPASLMTVLNQDARDMDMSPSILPPPSPPQNISELLGMVYVLEGASLGAQILVKQASQLGLSADFGARHLAMQSGSLNGWKTFLSLLEKAPQFDGDSAVEGARQLFCYALDAVRRTDEQAGISHG
jgi:heme oxygenase